MIYELPGNSFDAWLTGAPTGLVGTLTVRVEDADTGAVVIAETTSGITEPRAGKYKKTLTAPDTEADYFIVWKNGSTEVTEELFVTFTLPAGDAFISVSELGDYLGRDLSADAGAEICVAAASDFCRDISEQSFTRGTTTEYFDGTGTDALLLPQLPVNSVSAVSVADSSTPSTWNTAGTADYVLDNKGILYARDTAGTSLFGTCWPTGRQNVSVTYDHGYTDLPQSVRAIALAIASRLFVQGPTMFEQLGDQNVRYAAENTAVMPTEKAILRRYRRQ